ncbi:hypothetical protein GCM10009096_04990 [Parasphingorhabdus litoris]|uniref:Glycosyltransferase RgtA/B/C/D-like domain-containing protein n=1 Tax=Parasphingorhabdus litoris TaxID=394733 RepID=A0ABN1A4B4_9SPHN|nr:hypothetical protein [Parasphingorhabdus litoris]
MENANTIAPGRLNMSLKSLSSSRAYLLLCLAYFAVMIGYYLFDPFGFEHPGRDTWHHLAVLRELMASPFDPSNPHLPTDEPSRYYTPLNILAAMVGQMFGIVPWALFSFMGAAMCVAFCAVTWLFARRYYKSDWAPAILLTILLFAWGAQRGHAGFHNFATFISSGGYPATQALVLGMLSWFLCLFALEEDRFYRLNLALLAVLTATIVITHQFSAFIMLAGTGSFILFHKAAAMDRKMTLLAALFVGGLLSLIWPYFNPLDVVLSASDPRWESDAKEMTTISYLILMAAPTILGILGFRDAKTGRVRWDILAPVLFFTSAYFLLVALDMSIAHRFPPAIILYLQLALAWATVSSSFFKKTSPAMRGILTTAGIIFIGFSMYIASMPRQMEFVTRASHGRMIPSVDEMQAHLPIGSVSFATKNIVYPLQSTGHRVVSIPRPEPVAPSLFERQAATDKFFDADTSQAERRALIRKWKATHIAFAPPDMTRAIAKELRKFGPSRKFTRNTEIITIQTMEVE